MPSPRLQQQATVRILSPVQSIIGFGRRGDRLRKRDLVFEGQAHQLGFLDCLLGSLLRGSYDEVADTATLNFGRTLHDSQGIRGDPRLQAGGTGRTPGHFASPSLKCTVKYRTFQATVAARSDKCPSFVRRASIRLPWIDTSRGSSTLTRMNMVSVKLLKYELYFLFHNVRKFSSSRTRA